MVEVTVGGRPLTVAVADDPDTRGRGLMEVRDLGAVDGMLFSWGGETVTSRFTMRNTLISLDIAFFTADGELVDVLTMQPCDADPCPTYAASGAYAYAIEVPAGGFAGLDPSDRLVLPDA